MTTRQEALNRLLLAVEMAVDDFNAGDPVDFNPIREAFLATREARDPGEPTVEEARAELDTLKAMMDALPKFPESSHT